MPKIVDHEERRRALAEAAARTIVERGIDAVTMTAIAETAGVTTGAVTHYFADKDELILAALDWVDGAMRRRAERAMNHGDDPVSVLMEALPTDAEGRTEWLLWQVLGDRATRSRSLMAAQRASYRAWKKLLVSGIGRLQSERRIRADVDPELEADLVIALVDGIGSNAACDPRSWSAGKQRRLLESYLSRLAR